MAPADFPEPLLVCEEDGLHRKHSLHAIEARLADGLGRGGRTLRYCTAKSWPMTPLGMEPAMPAWHVWREANSSANFALRTCTTCQRCDDYIDQTSTERLAVVLFGPESWPSGPICDPTPVNVMHILNQIVHTCSPGCQEYAQAPNAASAIMPESWLHIKILLCMPRLVSRPAAGCNGPAENSILGQGECLGTLRDAIVSTCSLPFCAVQLDTVLAVHPQAITNHSRGPYRNI